MKPNALNVSRILLVVDVALAVLLVLVIGFGFSFSGLGEGGGGGLGNHIKTIEIQQQTTNGAQTTNYLPLLEDDFDWANATDAEREKIAKAAVQEALKLKERDQANIYNIMGLTGDRAPAFLYTGTGKIQIIVNNAVSGEVGIE
ncbi:MAG: hypothetical protein LBR00_06885 [Clostridiales Family XIII bacterium]|jgi:hypothetical protein|nr:hypothetical protein [Clostridiales Family XIII bacterium]